MSFTEKLVDFLNGWMDLFPKWFRQNLFVHLIYPKLKNFVEQWNPKDETVAPAHQWIHPWIPLFVDRIEITGHLFYIAQMKLCTLLKEWHPSDVSIRNLIVPWLEKFSTKSVNNIVENLVVPKLELLLLNELEIDPSDQVIEPFQYFLEWYSVVPDQHMVRLLDKCFFSKWLSILHYWLNQESPNFEEIAIWYKGWKSLIPKSFLEFESIQNNLSLALHMINYSSQGVDIGDSLEQFVASYTEETKRKSQPTTTTTPSPLCQQNPSAIKVSNYSTNNFKDIIEQYAGEQNILFKPIAANSMSYSDGKTYYQFGNTIIYIDRGVIFTKMPNYSTNSDNFGKGRFSSSTTAVSWHPISLQDLIESATQE